MTISSEEMEQFLSFDSTTLAQVTPWALNSNIEADFNNICSLLASRNGNKLLYFEWLQIHPIKINLSYSKAEFPPHIQLARSGQTEPLSSMTEVLGNIHGAPLRFNALILQNPIFAYGIFVKILREHYGDQLIQQVCIMYSNM